MQVRIDRDVPCGRYSLPHNGGMSIGDRMKARRKELGMSQIELGTASGVGQSNISRIERGETPNPGAGTLAAIATALKTTTEALTGAQLGYDARPILGNLEGIAPALAEAKKKAPHIPPDVWEEALLGNGLRWTRATPELVRLMADLVIATRVAEAEEAAEGKRIDDEEKKRLERQEDGERRVREAAARGEKLTLSRAMAQLRREQGEED